MLYDPKFDRRRRKDERKRERAGMLVEQLDRVLWRLNRGWWQGDWYGPIARAPYGEYTPVCLVAAITLTAQGSRKHIYDALARELPANFVPKKTSRERLVEFNDAAGSFRYVAWLLIQAQAKAAQIAEEGDQERQALRELASAEIAHSWGV